MGNDIKAYYEDEETITRIELSEESGVEILKAHTRWEVIRLTFTIWWEYFEVMSDGIFITQ